MELLIHSGHSHVHFNYYVVQSAQILFRAKGEINIHAEGVSEKPWVLFVQVILSAVMAEGDKTAELADTNCTVSCGLHSTTECPLLDMHNLWQSPAQGKFILCCFKTPHQL